MGHATLWRNVQMNRCISGIPHHLNASTHPFLLPVLQGQAQDARVGIIRFRNLQRRGAAWQTPCPDKTIGAMQTQVAGDPARWKREPESTLPCYGKVPGTVGIQPVQAQYHPGIARIVQHKVQRTVLIV